MNLRLGRRNFLSSLGAACAGLMGTGKLRAMAPTPGGEGEGVAPSISGHAGGRVGSMTSIGYPHVDGMPITHICA
jgi:hypothetical protein